MSTSYSFDGKIIKIPGVYSTIKSGIKNPPIDLGYGSCLIIDTGSGAGYGGGSGITGTLKSGIDSIYTFDNISDFRSFVGGGLMWFLAEPLFKPSQLGVAGVSSLSIIRAATTVAAEISYTWDGGSTNGGVITFQVKTEGVAGNGVEDGDDVLRTGYSAVMSVGVVDTGKFLLSFYRGTYKGLDTAVSNGDPYDGVVQGDSEPELLARSIEFDNISDLLDWCNNDVAFNTHFKLKTLTPAGTGAVTNDDLVANPGNKLAISGTTTYNEASLNLALDAIADINFDFILCDRFGADALDTENLLILSYVASDAKIKPDVYIGGGSTASKFSGAADASIELAASLDSQYATLVHSGIKKTSRKFDGFKTYSSIVHAAYVLGREAGLQPQVPLTFKGININGLSHQLNDSQVEQCLDGGVIATRFSDGSYDIVKGINTLQNNDFLINEDGTTSSKQLRRIARQLNKEISVNAKRQLLKQTAGVNRNTLSEQDVAKWLEGYLTQKTATASVDNLIISFQDISVETRGDAYFISYAIVPNFEVSYLFFTGFIIDNN